MLENTGLSVQFIKDSLETKIINLTNNLSNQLASNISTIKSKIIENQTGVIFEVSESIDIQDVYSLKVSTNFELNLLNQNDLIV